MILEWLLNVGQPSGSQPKFGILDYSYFLMSRRWWHILLKQVYSCILPAAPLPQPAKICPYGKQQWGLQPQRPEWSAGTLWLFWSRPFCAWICLCPRWGTRPWKPWWDDAALEWWGLFWVNEGQGRWKLAIWRHQWVGYRQACRKPFRAAWSCCFFSFDPDCSVKGRRGRLDGNHGLGFPGGR